MKCNYIIILFLLISVSAASQKISRIYFEKESNKINVYYDLDAKSTTTFKIQLYKSMNSGQSWDGPLQKVSGNVGENQSVGNSKKIVWDILNEYGDFFGDIIFKVTALESTIGTFIDNRDGKEYTWINFGQQIWMAENLDNSSSGTKYPGLTLSSDIKLGRLYNWDEAVIACPDGWHLPSNEEWAELSEQFGGEKNAGSKLKSSTIWDDDFTGTNESGFSAIPGGLQKSNGEYYDYGNTASWWSSAEYKDDKAWSRSIGYDPDEVLRRYDDKKIGLSVRCVKDN